MLGYDKMVELINDLLNKRCDGVSRYSLESEAFVHLPVDDVYIEKNDKECSIELHFSYKYDAIKVAEGLDISNNFFYIKRDVYNVVAKRRI